MMLSEESCKATLQHLIAASLASGRGVTANELIADLAVGDDLRNGPAALDSLDQLSVARRVAEFFELEKAGIEEWLLRRSSLDVWSRLVLESLNNGAVTHLWFRSGGSSAEPGLISQPLSHLLKEADNLRELVGSSKRIIALVPLHHIYGFIWGPLLSSQMAVPLLHGPEAQAAAHNDLRSGDLLLGFPQWWRYFGGVRGRLPAGVSGVTSTAPCPPEYIEQVLACGLQTMIEVYGSSETAGIGWRDSTAGGYRLFRHWARHGDHCLESDQGNIVPLPDRVQWRTDRSLVPTGRRDNAVQVGGINVWPERVRAFIETHARVGCCTVRPMNTEQGTRLKVFVVPVGPAGKDLHSELRDWFRAGLPTAERPIHITVGDQLPRDHLGKLCDW
ncbi:hypothetical protein [Marinobacter sp.]|uniref:hypothetical protein n=1 Tax=Marinobacter sp. TaxID=50741 RepID=UPI002B4635E5|nr:hypothetical protein [Marinobacter sp.]HKK54846.1 hypothetical protein [Marinobacter sp.]